MHDDHHHPPANFGPRLLVAMALNASYGMYQLSVSLREAHSSALLADAFHNISDVANIGIPSLAIYFASKPANSRWTTGYGRGKVTGSVFNYSSLLVLMIGAVVMALYRFVNPTEVSGGQMSRVALVGIGINLGTVLMLSAGRKDLDIGATFWHQAGDLVSSLGVVVAGVIIARTGWNVFDPIITILMSAGILFMIRGGLRESWRILNGGTPADVDTDGITDWLKSLPGIVDVHKFNVFSTSTSSHAVTFHLLAAGNQGQSLSLNDIRHHLAITYKVTDATIQVEGEADRCPHVGHLYGMAEAEGECHHEHLGHAH